MNGQQIQKIEPAGLNYLDEVGKLGFIDFLVCHQNFVQRSTTPEALENVKEWNHMNDDDLNDYVRGVHEWRVVAGRYFSSSSDKDRPYIEFYTEPPIRFEFRSPQEFQRVIYLLKNAGWRTRDLT